MRPKRYSVERTKHVNAEINGPRCGQFWSREYPKAPQHIHGRTVRNGAANAQEATMADYIWEGERQVAYIKDGFAFDRQNEKRYRVEGDKLLDPKTGQIVAYLTQAGKPGTVSKKGLFD
jgi:hypothetical protein